MAKVRFQKLLAAARVLWADTDGVILPYVTVMLVVFVGAGALALDGARYMSLQTQMQKAADALALAGAAELDRLSTSTTRAQNAINNMLTNSSLFAGDVTVSSIRFLASPTTTTAYAKLPAQDVTPITAYMCTAPCTSAAFSIEARFVEVVVQPKTITTILPVGFFGGGSTLTTGASAVAGRDGVSCGLTPMFICNPFEQTGDTYDQATQRLEDANTNASTKRRLIRMSENSNGAAGTWGPGDFGYLVPEPGSLDPDTNNCFAAAGSDIGVALAAERPLICVRQNGVDLLTGNTTEALNGLNTRFGQYSQNDSSACKTQFPPDKNVRTGYLPGAPKGTNWCNGSPDETKGKGPSDWPPGTTKSALPADLCLRESAGCSAVTGYTNLGDTSWDCLAYWGAVHQPYGRTAPAGCTATATISRYDVYNYENDPAQCPGCAGDIAPTGETATPLCTGTTGREKRRILNVAIVNCRALPSGTVQAKAKDVPVAAFGKFFLTTATPHSGTQKPFAEFIGLLERGDGVIYDQVQLYR